MTKNKISCLKWASMLLFTISASTAFTQQKHKITLSLEQVIETARDQSPNALVAKHNFLANYWSYRSYKAQFLPSLKLTANLGQYDRSLRALQNSETGEINYIANNNLRNSLSLSVNQNIPLTGGKISLSTNLNRLDQFSPFESKTYSSIPISLNYDQPLKAFNTLKWDKIIEPKSFEKAKRVYLESLEDINIQAVNLFFNVLSAQMNREMARKKYASTELSLKIAEERFSIGGPISKNELLQLRLGLYNAKLEIGDSETNYDMSVLRLRTFLGFNDNVEIVLSAPGEVPEVQLEFNDVYNRALENSSTTISNELTLLNAQQSVAQAKASNGLQASLFAQFGLTQKGSELSSAYKNPMDQEIIGLSLSLPILDWGLGKGKVKLAQSREEVVRTQLEQQVTQYREDMLIKVLEFNKMNTKCNTSSQADSIARLRYEIASEKFKNGTLSVLELNSAQTDMDNSASRYISEVGKFWQNYYTIRKLSLYDYLTKKQVSADFDKLTN
ncbi:MAG: TolC family protein [Bacteroidales bacterium]